jgi:hypothetical protein
MEEPKVLLQVEIFCNEIIEDYEDTLPQDFIDLSEGWYECATAILKLIEEKRKIL